MLGQHVQKHVEQEHRLELGLVQTLLPNTVELTVLEMLKKLRTATLKLVQVRVCIYDNLNNKSFQSTELSCYETVDITNEVVLLLDAIAMKAFIFLGFLEVEFPGHLYPNNRSYSQFNHSNNFS